MFDKVDFFQNLFLIATLGASLLAFRHKQLMNQWIFDIVAIRKGQWFRLLSSGFIHADYIHLGFNMFTYYSFAYLWGDIYSQYFGLAWWWFGIFYISAIVLVNLSVLLLEYGKSQYRSLGASGGVSAVLFACILLFPTEKLYVMFLPMPAIVFGILYLAYSLYQSIYKRKDDTINHFAHLVGSIYGIVFSLIIEPATLSIFVQKLVNAYL